MLMLRRLLWIALAAALAFAAPASAGWLQKGSVSGNVAAIGSPPTLIQALTGAGLATDLQLALDAGDPNSYPGSGQTWFDTSGNDYDFFLGADGDAGTSDPTFVSAGKQSYFSFDGGDYFRYGSANEAWMNGLHKNNAAFTLLAQFYIGSTGTAHGLAGTSAGAGTNIGTDWRVLGPNTHGTIVNNGVGGQTAKNGTVAGTTSAWNCLAVSYNEGADVSVFQTNGSNSTTTAAVASPNSADATYTFEIAARGNAVTPAPSGDRMAKFAAWSRALSAAEMSAACAAIGGTFGS